jgi:hypothetical protein
VEEISQFCQAAKWKDATENSCYPTGKVVLAPLHDLPQRIQTVVYKPFVFRQGQLLQQHLCIYVHGFITYGRCPN